MHFGFPHLHGEAILDPEFGRGRNPHDFATPVRALGAHVAALGMRFDGPDRIFIAEHGSWNRSAPVGYRIVEIRLEGDRAGAIYRIRRDPGRGTPSPTPRALRTAPR